MDDSARILALRLALSAFDTPACNTFIAEIGDRGRLMAVTLEMVGLLEEALEENDRGGAIAWIESRLAAELDAGAGTGRSGGR